MLDDLLEAWRTNNRINLYLIDQISDEGMNCSLSERGGRNVAGQFAHLHNIRLAQLQGRAKELSHGLEKFPPKVTPSKAQLKDALSASGNAIEAFLEGVLAGAPKRRGFKKGVFTTLSYFVAHESHHRGSILLTLKQCGHNLDKAVRYAIWGWDRM